MRKYTYAPQENITAKDMTVCRGLLPMTDEKWARMSERLHKQFIVTGEPEPVEEVEPVAPEIMKLPARAKRHKKA